MFCPNCGQQVPDDSQFCDGCGASLVEEGKEVSAPAQATPKKKSETVERVTKYVKDNKVVVGIVAAVLVVAIALTIFFTTRPMKIDLNDYVKVTYDGYSTAGTASLSFDREAFSKDFAGKLKYQGKHSDEFGSIFNDEAICWMFLSQYVDCGLNKDSDLSNGDTVTVKWDCEAEKAKADFGVKLVCKDKDFTVEGLKLPKEVDPFEALEVVFSGTAPNGEARMKLNSDIPYAYSLDFEMSASSSLKNGDTITVTVANAESEKNTHYLLRKYGITLTKTEQTYTVSGLQTYVSKLSEINDDAWAKMQAQCEDILKATVAKSWSKECTMKGAEYVGSYLLTSKKSESYNNNYIYLLYKVTASIKYTDNDTKEEVEDTFTFYYGVRFRNLMIAEDGTVTVDLSRYDNSNRIFYKTYGYHSYYFRGYETLDEAYANCVTGNIDRYTVETNIKAE